MTRIFQKKYLGIAFLAGGSVSVVAGRFRMRVGHSHWFGQFIRGFSVRRQREQEIGRGRAGWWGLRGKWRPGRASKLCSNLSFLYLVWIMEPLEQWFANFIAS